MYRNSHWWKKAFGENYFEIAERLYPNQTDLEMRFLRAYLPRKKGASVLDVACGGGRHSLALAALGYRMAGVDYSSAAIRIARRGAKQRGLSVQWKQADASRMRLHQKFDAAFCIGHAFGYGDDADHDRLIGAISRHLKRGALFILEGHNVWRLQQTSPHNRFGVYEDRFLQGADRYVVRETFQSDPQTLTRVSHWTMTKNHRTVYSQHTQLRFYTFPELRAFLERWGFQIVNVFGSYNKKAFTFASPTLIVVARKK